MYPLSAINIYINADSGHKTHPIKQWSIWFKTKPIMEFIEGCGMYPLLCVIYLT